MQKAQKERRNKKPEMLKNWKTTLSGAVTSAAWYVYTVDPTWLDYIHEPLRTQVYKFLGYAIGAGLISMGLFASDKHNRSVALSGATVPSADSNDGLKSKAAEGAIPFTIVKP
jgi:hypothetical protein